MTNLTETFHYSPISLIDESQDLFAFSTGVYGSLDYSYCLSGIVSSHEKNTVYILDMIDLFVGESSTS